ncbi:MCP four helix bundle domain-containing protein [Mariniflexile sp.]|uniref:MCP four helix bundle domain-containing protein n=1 Tax=Mariniflexile sp. TaxID=1979402 RepID=UPI004047A40C
MFKKISTSNRINIGFALLVVFLLVLATNRIDKRHFETVQHSLSTVYKDRVVAQDYIYRMNTILHKKEIQLLYSNSTNGRNAMNKEFQTLMDVFSTTKLTLKESKVFESLKENFKKLKIKEQTSANKEVINYLESLRTDLNNLELIQVSESKQMTDIAQKSLNNNKLISQLEIGFLILVGVLFQFIIFYRVKKSKNE